MFQFFINLSTSKVFEIEISKVTNQEKVLQILKNVIEKVNK